MGPKTARDNGHSCRASGGLEADGDAPGTRTPNLVIKSHLLCQLS